MGSTLICFLMSEQTAGLLCWLQPVLQRTGMGGLSGFASAAFPVPWDFWVQYKVSAEYLKTACQRKKHNSSNIIAPLNEGYLWRDYYFYPCLSSAYCICISANKALAFFFFFYFFPPNRLLLRDFCNSFQFSWDSTCYSKRSIEIQFSENLSILEQGLLNCGIVSQGCRGSDFACNIWNCWNKTLEITESRANEIFAGTELGFGRQERSMEAVLIFLFFKYPTSNSGYTRNECFLFFKKRKSQKITTYVKEYMCSPPTV